MDSKKFVNGKYIDPKAVADISVDKIKKIGKILGTDDFAVLVAKENGITVVCRMEMTAALKAAHQFSEGVRASAQSIIDGLK